MTENMKQVYRDYIQNCNEVKRLLQVQNELKQQIIASHNGQEIICEDGFESKISHCTRKTPLIPSIQALLGRDLPDDCFKITPYDALRVQILED